MFPIEAFEDGLINRDRLTYLSQPAAKVNAILTKTTRKRDGINDFSACLHFCFKDCRPEERDRLLKGSIQYNLRRCKLVPWESMKKRGGFQRPPLWMFAITFSLSFFSPLSFS